MNFWEAQKRARSKTKFYVALFLFLAVFVAFLIEVFLRYFNPAYTPEFPVWGAVFILATGLVAFFQYTLYRTQGGSYVAESVGAKKVDPDTRDFFEKQLLNIVQEISIAAAVPLPAVYILNANEINAFAAGTTQTNAAVTITTGALEKLNREEIQGVIAHEFGHIVNGDMKISLQLSAMVMGFFFIAYFGIRMLQISSFASGGGSQQRRGANPVLLIALAFCLAGAFTWFFGSILRASVSREREYLADASAVQYTRTTSGIANALKKIAKYQKVSDMPTSGMAYSHLYFDNHSGLAKLFSTHPPLAKRISTLEGREYIPEEWHIES